MLDNAALQPASFHLSFPQPVCIAQLSPTSSLLVQTAEVLREVCRQLQLRCDSQSAQIMQLKAELQAWPDAEEEALCSVLYQESNNYALNILLEEVNEVTTPSSKRHKLLLAFGTECSSCT